MESLHLALTYIGGPTALLRLNSASFLTDPTFDPAGEYPGPVTLRKLAGPALDASAIGGFDYVLLSHDHHYDNLDGAGRSALSHAKSVLTTRDGAGRLGGNSRGLEAWQEIDLPASDGRMFRITATPARHGPPDGDRGPVIGFVIQPVDAPEQAVYFSGDTVWYQGVVEVARRFPIRAAILNLGAARVPEVGPAHLTMTAAEAVEAARTFSEAVIVPLHFEGWAHFSEGRTPIERTFTEAGLVNRLRWPEAGHAIEIAL